MRRRSSILAFLLFLIRPEDSSSSLMPQGRQPSPFDNRLGGAIKIFCWIAIAVGFWIALPLLGSLFTGS